MTTALIVAACVAGLAVVAVVAKRFNRGPAYSFTALGAVVYDCPADILAQDGQPVVLALSAACKAVGVDAIALDGAALTFVPGRAGATSGSGMEVGRDISRDQIGGYISHEACHVIMNRLPGFPKDEAGQHRYMFDRAMAWAPGVRP